MSRWIAAALVLIANPAAAEESRFDAALSDFRELHRSETGRAKIAGSSFYVVRDGRTVVADHLASRTPTRMSPSMPTPSIIGHRSPRR